MWVSVTGVLVVGVMTAAVVALAWVAVAWRLAGEVQRGHLLALAEARTEIVEAIAELRAVLVDNQEHLNRRITRLEAMLSEAARNTEETRGRW